MSLLPYDAELLRALCEHIGFEPGPERGPDELVRLHRAFLDRVPYENLEIQLSRRTTIQPADSARRIVTGRGGYCFHLNGTLAGLLATLGYDVRLARGKVTGHPDTGWGEHLVPLVDVPGETWVVDVGLGDGFRDPMPLAEAALEQHPFAYRWERLDDRYWRFHHDERASIPGFDLDTEPVPLQAFEAMHAELSTSPSSSFVQKLVVQQRLADRALTLRGCVFTEAAADGVRKREVLDEAEWFGLLYDTFGLRLADIDDEALSQMWKRVRTAHESWVAGGRP
ncbi:arylamine N-acetyltransferase family protein [Flindersiella endophytica]